jgi:hypothetical protein
MRSTFLRRGSGRKACGRRKTHLQVERLDERTVPSTITVTNLLDSGAHSLRQSILDANSPAYPGADVINFNVTGTINLASALPDLSTGIDIEGPGANLLTVRRDTGGYYSVFTVASGATVTLSGLTVTNGWRSMGAGINNAGTLTVNNATISGNCSSSDYVGGGILNTGTCTLNYSTVDGNDGCGIASDGTLTLNFSTVSRNHVGFGYGAGIYNLSPGTLSLNDSTVSNNTANAMSNGGGIYNSGTATVNRSTISANNADWGGGGIWNDGTLHVGNSIIAGNTGGYEPDFVPDDLVGDLGSLGHNLIGYTNGGPGFGSSDLLNVDPLLGPLQDNGGPTFTCVLLPGSPAINAGDNTDAPPLDQRGRTRIVNGTIDIGACEFQGQPGNRVSTTTALTSSADTLTYGESVTYTATVSSSQTGSLTGTAVTFRDGGMTLGSVILDANSQAQFTSSPSAGTHTITALYVGSETFDTSTSAPLTVTISRASTTTALASPSVNPSVYGQPVIFTAIVHSIAWEPTGTVTFYDGATVLGTGTLSSWSGGSETGCTGQVQFTTSSLVAGTHAITTSYNGDTNFSGSTSPQWTQTVNPVSTLSTTTTLTSSVNPSVYGQSMTFTATVTPKTGGRGTPTGTVTFYYDGSTYTGTLDASGSATFSTSALSVGNHSITAVYGGNANYKGSTSAKLTQKVKAATRTATTLNLSLNPSAYGQSVSLTPSDTAASPGARTPTESVTLANGSTSTGRQGAPRQRQSGFHSPVVAFGQWLDHRRLEKGIPIDKASTSAKLTWRGNA